MRTIALTQGQVALIDDEDFERVSAFKWYAKRNQKSKNYYAASSSITAIRAKGSMILMHRLVLGFPLSLIDHRNRDTLDNRRCNLRLATRSQNGQNSELQKNNRSGFKGVSFDSYNGKWRARIKVAGRKRHLGYFDTPEEAHEAYKKAADQLFGEFAR